MQASRCMFCTSHLKQNPSTFNMWYNILCVQLLHFPINKHEVVSQLRLHHIPQFSQKVPTLYNLRSKVFGSFTVGMGFGAKPAWIVPNQAIRHNFRLNKVVRPSSVLNASDGRSLPWLLSSLKLVQAKNKEEKRKTWKSMGKSK